LTLGAFLEAYIKGRSVVKGATALVYRHTQQCLVDYFGVSKPLGEVTAGDADDWRRWLATEDKLADGTIRRKRLGENTIRRRCGVARQFFRAALRKRLIAENPFGEMKGYSVRSNKARDYYLTAAGGRRQSRRRLPGRPMAAPVRSQPVRGPALPIRTSSPAMDRRRLGKQAADDPKPED
jgi:hypothetical protein